MRGNSLLCSFFCLALFGLPSPLPSLHAQTVAEEHARKLDEFLVQGKLVAAASHFRSVLEQQPDEPTALLALGLTEFLQALEYLGNSNYRFGTLSNSATEELPLLRLPVPENPHPDQVSYDELCSVIKQFQGKVRAAESTLARVKTENVYLPLYLGRARLDLNGDGAMGDEETLWRICRVIAPQLEQAQGEAFVVGVDGADVHWLRGYCHFLQAVCDMVLAYDERQLFERCGQLVFPNIETPFLAPKDRGRMADFDLRSIADAIAAIHLIRFPVVAPERMRAAHGHLLAMVQQSRLCWERVLAETDDRNEWIPNPQQTSVLGVAVPREIITGWSKVLDEFEQLLQGKKLIPYWRQYSNQLFGFGLEPADQIPEQGKGLNLRRIFFEPQELDLILWLQGTGVEVYLEEGPLSTPEACNRLTLVFEGLFFGFAVWFN
ncbi:MAG: hypothetical protein ACK48X_01310 [Planctomycetota bacterium]